MPEGGAISSGASWEYWSLKAEVDRKLSAKPWFRISAGSTISSSTNTPAPPAPQVPTHTQPRARQPRHHPPLLFPNKKFKATATPQLVKLRDFHRNSQRCGRTSLKCLAALSGAGNSTTIVRFHASQIELPPIMPPEPNSSAS